MEINEASVNTALKKVGFVVVSLGQDHRHESDISYLLDFIIEAGRHCSRIRKRRVKQKRRKAAKQNKAQ